MEVASFLSYGGSKNDGTLALQDARMEVGLNFRTDFVLHSSHFLIFALCKVR